MMRFLPLFAVVAILIVGAVLLSGKRDQDVTILQGAPMPPLSEVTLAGIENSSLEHIFDRRSVVLVNFWGSWCGPCRQEHPYLLRLARDENIPIIGVNFNDTEKNAQRFLNELGNPYVRVVIADSDVMINWGVAAVPETFIIGPDRTVLYRHIGPITDKTLSGEFGALLKGE